MRKIAVFDLDKTVYEGSSMQSFLFEYLIPNKKISFKLVLEALLLVFRYHFRLISHNLATIQTMEISAKVLQGKSVEEVKNWQNDFFTKQRMYPHISELFSLLRKNNFEIYLISASIEPIVTACADVFGVYSYASNVVIKNGVYTGKIQQIMNTKEKAEIVKNLLQDATKSSISLGFGDSSGDLAMLSVVDHAFLFEPFEKDSIEFANQNAMQIVNRKDILEKVTQIL